MRVKIERVRVRNRTIPTEIRSVLLVVEVLVVSVRWFAFALFLCASFLSIGSTGAQGTSTLTVHARYCDPGVVPADPYIECHDNPLNDWDVLIDGATVGSTDTDGNFSQIGLAAGEYEMFVPIPLKGTTYSAYCSIAGGDGSFLDLADSGNGVAVPVAAGTEVICDWYWLISDGPIAGDTNPLTIHARVCPTDEVPDDIYAECHDSPLENIEYFISGASIGSTGADGNLVVDVTGDTVQLSGGAPGEFARNFIYCSNSETLEQVFAFTEIEFTADVPITGDGTTCDWYVVPEDLRGETPTPAPTATATTDDDDEVGGVKQLPNTGSGDSDEGMPASALMILAGTLCVFAGSTLVLGKNRR